LLKITLLASAKSGGISSITLEKEPIIKYMVHDVSEEKKFFLGRRGLNK